ncbi:hypothetical protein NPIL_98391 [Nephila pilipes]|uniref:Uncharacterized protein n=1 Tax=Nephila pilipes TaxID=299642 RepID=A0A8X6T981_NEPPI|nr:hypothetical protein NPIL_98391 [Nephila pilipes]
MFRGCDSRRSRRAAAISNFGGFRVECVVSKCFTGLRFSDVFRDCASQTGQLREYGSRLANVRLRFCRGAYEPLKLRALFVSE